MKTKIILISLLFLYVKAFSLMAGNQLQDTISNPDQPRHIITKNDNSQYTGVIIFQDAREVIIRTENIGEVSIPKHEIKDIREANPKEYRKGLFIGEELFATRYFLTTNGLPIQKGDNYIQWNLYGPDIQFGIADNFGIGIMTSWLAWPVIGTAKYSIKLGENSSLALGGLLGTGTWAQPDFGLALPFTAVTLGNRSHNINLSAGYGFLFYSTETYNYNLDREFKEKNREGRFVFSVGAMTKLSPVVSLVFDSFIMPAGPYRTQSDWQWNESTNDFTEVITNERTSAIMVFVPGIRLQTQAGKAFQIGFGGAYTGKEFGAVPIPMLQWYRNL